MIFTVLRGRFYKIFVSPMLHKNPSQNGLRGIFRILYPKKYPILSPKSVKKVTHSRQTIYEESCQTDLKFNCKAHLQNRGYIFCILNSIISS